MFLTNNSPDFCILTLCIKFRQNNWYLASIPTISANSMKIIDLITSGLWIIFLEILNFYKIYNPSCNRQYHIASAVHKCTSY